MLSRREDSKGGWSIADYRGRQFCTASTSVGRSLDDPPDTHGRDTAFVCDFAKRSASTVCLADGCVPLADRPPGAWITSEELQQADRRVVCPPHVVEDHDDRPRLRRGSDRLCNGIEEAKPGVGIDIAAQDRTASAESSLARPDATARKLAPRHHPNTGPTRRGARNARRLSAYEAGLADTRFTTDEHHRAPTLLGRRDHRQQRAQRAVSTDERPVDRRPLGRWHHGPNFRTPRSTYSDAACEREMRQRES